MSDEAEDQDPYGACLVKNLIPFLKGSLSLLNGVLKALSFQVISTSCHDLSRSVLQEANSLSAYSEFRYPANLEQDIVKVILFLEDRSTVAPSLFVTTTTNYTYQVPLNCTFGL